MDNIIILTASVCFAIGVWDTQFNKFKLMCTFDTCTNCAGANAGSFNPFQQEDSNHDFREDSTTAQSSAKTVSCEVHQRGTKGCQLHWIPREVKAGCNPLGANQK